MLYKVWQSSPDLYRRRYRFGVDHGLESYNAKYSEIYGLWTTGEAQGGSVSQVYVMANLNPHNVFLQRGHMAKWDGTTGDLLWTDISYSTLNFSWSFRDELLIDDENRLWTHYISGFSGGKMYRFAVITTSENDTARAAGMPDMNTIDKGLYDGEWLNEDGTDYAFFYILGPTVRTLGISNRGDWVAMLYSSGTTIAIHNLKDKRRRGYIKLRDTPLKGVVIDSETLYIFSNRGTVEVIDVPRLQHLGLVVFGDYKTPGATYNGIGVGYDRVYRRLLTFVLRPDDPVTGQCQSYVEGWAIDEVGERLTKPLPLRAPKIGRNVPVLGRVYGWEGRGTGGAEVKAELQLGNGTIGPATQAANSSGVTEYIWVPETEGVDAADIKLTTTLELADQNIVLGEQISYATPAPTQVVEDGQEAILFPGYWLYSPSSTRVRTRTLQNHLEGYLEDYLPIYDGEDNLIYDPPDSPWKGVLLEYSWYELETTNGGYDFADLDADIAYAASKGLKVMLAINSANPVADGQAWVPNYIVQDGGGIYATSWTAPGMSGVFAPQYSDLNARGLLPLITDQAVLARIVSLALAVVTRYRDGSTLVGLCPLDHCNRDSRTFTRSSGVNYDVWLQARRDILEQSKSNSCIVFDWTGPQLYDTIGTIPSSHASWCAGAGIGLLMPKFPSDDYEDFTSDSTSYLTGYDHQVVTGVVLSSATWSSEHNLQCADSLLQDTFDTLVFGGQNLSETDCLRHHVERSVPWILFVDPDGGEWGSTDTGTLAITSSQRLAKDLGYNN